MTPENLVAERAAGVWLMDVLELVVRQQANVWPKEKLGAALGRRCEMEFLQEYFPGQTDWTFQIREVLQEHFLSVVAAIHHHEDFGDFALPGEGRQTRRLSGAAGENGGARPKPLYVPERLKFYMQLDPYVEIRALQGQNKNCYAVFVFSADEQDGNGRYVLDSTIYGNRLFCLVGTLEEVLSVAQLTKREIAASSHCRAAPEHDHDGKWKAAIKQFVS